MEFLEEKKPSEGHFHHFMLFMEVRKKNDGVKEKE